MAHPFGHIACWVDGSRSAALALDTALALQLEAAGRLSLLHALPPSQAGQAERLREQWLRRRGDEVPRAEPVFLEGHDGDAVCEWAREAQPDVIVVGARSGRLPGLPAGGMADQLLEQAPCDVLIVADDAPP